MLKSIIKKNTPAFVLRWLHENNLYSGYLPRVGEVNPGDFARLTPFSEEFGYERGGPIDRYYIENFLQKEAGSIRGHAMEVGDNTYTMQFGGEKITKSDILHVNDTNPAATIVGDISNAPQIPDNTFDCIVLTQTLQLVYDFKGALETCHRILKPGGTLLLTVPYITPIEHGQWKETWYWAFTGKVMQKLMDEIFVKGQVEVNTFGNAFAASAFIYGMGVPEVTKEKLDYHDPHFQIIITVKGVKAA